MSIVTNPLAATFHSATIRFKLTCALHHGWIRTYRLDYLRRDTRHTDLEQLRYCSLQLVDIPLHHWEYSWCGCSRNVQDSDRVHSLQSRGAVQPLLWVVKGQSRYLQQRRKGDGVEGISMWRWTWRSCLSENRLAFEYPCGMPWYKRSYKLMCSSLFIQHLCE